MESIRYEHIDPAETPEAIAYQFETIPLEIAYAIILSSIHNTEEARAYLEAVWLEFCRQQREVQTVILSRHDRRFAN